MSLEQPPKVKISFENGFETYIPDDFKNNPIDYVEKFGRNIKSGDKYFDNEGRLREDPTAVKILPECKTEEKTIIPVAKIVDPDKGKVGESGNPLYEYNIIKYVRSLGLPAPTPILSAEQNGRYVFLTEKVFGVGWYEKDSLHLNENGWTEEEINNLLIEAEQKMAELSVKFEKAGIKRSWKLKDMIFDIDFDKKNIKSIIPTDFERTKIISNK